MSDATEDRPAVVAVRDTRGERPARPHRWALAMTLVSLFAELALVALALLAGADMRAGGLLAVGLPTLTAMAATSIMAGVLAIVAAVRCHAAGKVLLVLLGWGLLLVPLLVANGLAWAASCLL